MKHLLLIYGDPTHPAAEQSPPTGAFGDWVEATRALDEAGVLLEGDGLVHGDSSSVSRKRDTRGASSAALVTRPRCPSA